MSKCALYFVQYSKSFEASQVKLIAHIWYDANGPLLKAKMLCNQSPGAVYPALINYRNTLLALRDIKSLREQELEDFFVLKGGYWYV
ncbi:MAG: hypothetical protein ACK5GN_14240 [Pseudomonadota bacterium]|jgi:hypothetical protein